MSQGLVRLPPGSVAERVGRMAPDFPGLVAVYLFGSALGKFRPDSDIDLGIIMRYTADPRTEDRLELALGAIDGHPFHVTTLNPESVLAFRVVKEGTLVYSDDEGLRTDFLARAALQHHYDAPHIRTAELALRKKVGF